MYDNTNYTENPQPVRTVDAFGEPIDGIDTINGIPVTDYSTFIGGNSSRYIALFRKNEKKKWFLSMNWAAFFLSVYWMFYRKMYLQGLIFLLVSMVLSSCLMAGLALRFSDEIKALSDSSDTQMWDENYAETVKQADDLKAKIVFYSLAVSIAFGFLFGAFADCLYRNQVLRKIRYSDGGTSKWSILGALVLVWISNQIGTLINAAIIQAVLK